MATLDANGPVQLQMNPIFTGDPDAAPPPADDDDDPAAAVVAAADVAADDPPELSLPHPAVTATTPTVTNATTQPRRVIDLIPLDPDRATPTPPHSQ